ncbi:DHHC palmitoyltransferase-domain-containing protein [Blakeslea trispora]|nr:DHHC palmitoyltransferase-domain-containing protein [Blakeslea trispora]
MDVPDKSPTIEPSEQQQTYHFAAAFQPTFFHSSLKPESVEDFDFESAPMTNLSETQHVSDDDPIPLSSSFTAHSNVASSFASTTPILHLSPTHAPPLPRQDAYSLTAIEHSNNITEAPFKSKLPSSSYILREQPYRNYQIFPGHTRFLLHGRLVTSGDYRAFFAGLFLLITPSVLFAVFTCPFLWSNVHPAIPIVFAYLFVLTLVSMLKTSWTDPGIIPRNLDPLIEQEIQDNASFESTTPPKEIWIKNTPYSLTYCETCNIYRPPRSSHCRQCDNCVEFEDHHCAWLNNCIGKRNYRTFFTFITSAAILCIFVITSCIYELIYFSRQSASFSDVFSQAPVSFVLCIYCFILLWLVGGLTLYHCSLVLRGVTTHEQIRADIIKAKYPELGANPYNKHNPFRNMIQVLCQPQPKSYLRRRKMADPVIEKL